MSKKEYLVLLSTFPSFGPARLSLLLSYFKGERGVWEASFADLRSLGLSERLVSEFISHKESFDTALYFRKIKELRIGILTSGEPAYPKNLLGLTDSPRLLYVKGEIKKQDRNAVAIVGARKATSYGREAASLFASSLAKVGVTVVSGLARGVDTAAHEGALAAGGRTIAVVASGLDNVYPPENRGLAKRISEAGCVITEYPLGTPALAHNFPVRNRIISGLSKAVLIVEGRIKSGTLLTAKHALDQGREVFAIPGAITSPLSEAPLYLLKNGARLATAPQDLLEELGIEKKVEWERLEGASPEGKEEEKLLTTLDSEELHLDEIVRISKIETARVLSALSIMELKGMVKNIGRGIYRKT